LPAVNRALVLVSYLPPPGLAQPYTPKMIRPTAATISANSPNGWTRSVFSAVSRPPALDGWYLTASVTAAPNSQEQQMIILGEILLVIGFIAGVAIIWTVGIIVVIAGAILALLGMAGHSVGGRKHYY
jgi:hypothetical protein